MMKNQHFTKGARKWILCLLQCMMATFLLSSCEEDLGIKLWGNVIEGEDATISLSVELPTMTAMTRVAGIDPNSADASRVSDLWIGIYNVNTGKRTGYIREDYNEVFNNDHNNNGHHSIEIDALSGMSYIVAVANASQNNGVAIDGGGQKPLTELLENADTWEKYKDIAVLLNSPQSIQYAGSGMLMSGIYYPNHENINYQEYISEDNPQPVAIEPGTNNLNLKGGCVQLRRVAAYVKFNIKVAEEYQDFITFTPVSWQVCNLPGLSYVHERSGNNNAADHEVKDLPQDFEQLTYHNTPIYDGAQLFPTDAATKVSSFDFYMMENKHTAREGASLNDYSDREREHKTADDKNTGWYQSLVESAGDEVPAKPSYEATLLNNNASFVVIRARLVYYYLEGDETYTPVAPPTDSNTPGYVRRVGDAIYTIHLGYCENEKLADYNCRRNTQYTYNVTVYGVDNIRVEAVKDGEKESGAEGIVTDVIGNVIELDSHYGVFNIQLSDEDRMNLSWRVQSPFGDQTIDMMYSVNALFEAPGLINLHKDSDKQKALPGNQFYNWIQFRPTTGEKVLAHYPGDPRLIDRKILNDDPQTKGEYYLLDNISPVAQTSSDPGIWYLEQMRDVVQFSHPEIQDNAYKDYLKLKLEAGGITAILGDDEKYKEEFTKKRWYTVFVDEYVYEYEYDSTKDNLTKDYGEIDGESGVMDIKEWGKFVNRDARKVWIALSNFAISNDSESLYANAAYFISQESIQTYYTDKATQAIGIECTNESFKKNFGEGGDENRRDKNLPKYHNGEYHSSDGLLNMYWYVTDKTTSSRWCHVILDDEGKSEDNGKQLDSDVYNSRNNRPRVGAIRTGTVVSEDDAHTYYIPDHEDTFMSACLARNRDLNNDGVIGANEIRWYLPTDATYTRIILGAVSLRNPLFNMNDFQMDDIRAGVGTAYSHYAGSNNRMVWAEELAATSEIYQHSNFASNIRCIRNLGQEMNLVPDQDPKTDYQPIDQAYHVDKENYTVELDYYDMTALREYTRNTISAHVIGEIRSYASRKFKYAKDDCKPSNTTQTGFVFENNNGGIGNNNSGQIFTSDTYNGGERRTFTGWWNILGNNSICGNYSEETDGADKGTWRIPNISELAILRLLNLVYDRTYMSASYEYFTNRNGRGNYEPNQHWFMGLNNVGDITAQPSSSLPIYVRCVKDVE